MPSYKEYTETNSKIDNSEYQTYPLHDFGPTRLLDGSDKIETNRTTNQEPSQMSIIINSRFSAHSYHNIEKENNNDHSQYKTSHGSIPSQSIPIDNEIGQ